MNTKVTNHRRRTVLGASAVALAALLFLGGCESDATAPHDDAPALTQLEAAHQAGYVAKGAAMVAPEILRFDGSRNKDTYEHTLNGAIQGTVQLEYTLGGAGGSPAAWDTGDWAHMYTEPGTWLTMQIPPSGTVKLAFDVTAAIEQTLNTAVISGGGTYLSGVYPAVFEFTDLAVSQSGLYPDSGIMSFSGGGFDMTVTYDGTNIALISMGGVDAYRFNLETYLVTAIPQ